MNMVRRFLGNAWMALMKSVGFVISLLRMAFSKDKVFGYVWSA